MERTCTADCIKTGRNKGNRSDDGTIALAQSGTQYESLRAVPSTKIDNNERNKSWPVFKHSPKTFAATTKASVFSTSSRPQFSRDLVNHPPSAYYCKCFCSNFFIIRAQHGARFDFHSELRKMEWRRIYEAIAAPSFPRLLSQPLGS